MKLFKALGCLIFLFIAGTFFIHPTEAQAACTTTTCTVTANTNWSALGATPISTTTVAVCNGAILTVDVSTAVAATIHVGSDTSGDGCNATPGAGTLATNAGSKVTISGALSVGNGAQNGTINMSSGGTIVTNSISTANTPSFTPGKGTIQIATTTSLPSAAAFATYNNLTVSGSGITVTLGQATTLNGQLTLAQGTLASGNFNLNVKGNWTNNSGTSAFTAGSGTVSMNGSTNSNDVGQLSSIYCFHSTGLCNIAFLDNTTGAVKFLECTNSSCTTGIVNVVDGAGCGNLSGCSDGSFTPGINISMFCTSTTNCDIAYVDKTNFAVRFANCTSVDCSSGNINYVDGGSCALTNCAGGQTNGTGVGLSCISASNCSMVYGRGAGSLAFANCTTSSCSAGNVSVIYGPGCVISGCDSAVANTGGGYNIFCLPSTGLCKTATYHSGGDNSLVFINCTNVSCSAGSTRVIDGPGCVLTSCNGSTGLFPQGIYCPSDTNCEISAKDIFGNVLRVENCTNSACSTGTSTAADGTGSANLTNHTSDSVGGESFVYCTSSSNCTVSYYDATNTRLKVANCTNAACTSGAISVADGTGCSGLTGCSTSGNVGKATNIWCDSSSSTCSISYYDTTNTALKLANCTAVDCSAGAVSTTAGTNQGQVITGSAATTFNSLTISNTTEPVYASVNFSVPATMTVGSGATFIPGSSVVVNSGGAGTSTITGPGSGTGIAKVTAATGTNDFATQYKFNTFTLTNLTVDFTGTNPQIDNKTYGSSTAGGLTVDGSITTTQTATVGGTFTVSSGGNFSPSAGTITMNNGSTLSNSGTMAFNNLTLASSATVTDSVGIFSVAGTFTANSGSTLNFTETSNTLLPALTYVNLGVGTTADSSAVTYTLGGNTTASGVVTIGNGSSTAADSLDLGSSTLTLSGSGTPLVITATWGALNGNKGTVAYTNNGGATTITAATYYNLSITTTSARTITFTAGANYGLSSYGILTLTGTSGNILTLQSSSSSDWNLQLANGGTNYMNIKYVTVSHSNATSFKTIMATDSTNTDNGNNTNWQFSTSAQFASPQIGIKGGTTIKGGTKIQ